jgi:NADH-quinone oxidoreductase subunit J
MELFAFYIFAGIAVLASLGVISQKVPMHSVMLLIVSFGALAGLYVLLDAPFTAVTQIIVYAGAIMVLFLFVVMLLNQHKEDDPEAGPQSLLRGNLRAGVLLSVMLAIEVAWSLSRVAIRDFSTEPAAISSISSVHAIGTALFTTHSFAFEVTSVLILVSMVGAVVIARREH